MWTALVLVWISSVPLSRSHIVSQEPLMTKMWPKAVEQRVPRDTGSRADNKQMERTATVPPAPVTSATGIWAASLNSTRVTTEMTNRSTATAREGTTYRVTSGTPVPPPSSGPSAREGTTHRVTSGTPVPPPSSGPSAREGTTHRVTSGTPVPPPSSGPSAREGTTHRMTSGTPAPPPSSGPSAAGQTLPITTAGLSSLNTPLAEVPSTNVSTSPRTAMVATVAPHTTTVAAGTINTHGPTRTLSPAKSTPTNTSTRNPIPTSGAQTQGATIRVTTEQPVHSTIGRSTPSPSNATLEPTITRSEATTLEPSTTTRSKATTQESTTTTRSKATTQESTTTTRSKATTLEPATTPSVASMSSTTVTTTQLQTKEPAASVVPVPPTSPELEATSLATQPTPALPTRGTGGTSGPGTPLTTDWVETKATGGTASAGPTPRSSRDPKVPTTDLCQLSTQGQYLVVTTEPLTSSLVNKTLLLVVLIFGVTLLITVLVMFALQAYESYKKKDYTQVDYLINGMYADAEM